jgi:UDP-glucose 4-epimerase
MEDRDSNPILITGGMGFVGAHVAKRLFEKNYSVVCFDLKPREIDFIKDWNLPIVKGDVSKIDNLIKIVEKYRINKIIHSAAIPNEEVCRNDPLGSFNVNVKGTLNVSECSRRKDLTMIYISSQAVYGNLHSQDLTPIKEEETPTSIPGIYASHKILSEKIVNSYNQIYGLKTLILRPTWVYGPGQISVHNPISIILEKAIKKLPIILKQGGDHPIPFTYVKDLAESIYLSIIAKNLKHNIFNIDGGKLVTVREVAEAVKQIIPDAHIKIGSGYWQQLLEQTPIRGPGDLSKAKQELRYEPFYSIHEGIKEFAQYLMR